MEDERDPYLEVARKFFNEFLELKIQLDQGFMTPAAHGKEIRKWRRANEELKTSLRDLADRNRKLEDEVGTLEEQLVNLRGQLNEALIRGRLAKRIAKASQDFPLEEHMSEDAFREWQKILKEIPRYGH